MPAKRLSIVSYRSEKKYRQISENRPLYLDYFSFQRKFYETEATRTIFAVTYIIKVI